MFRTRKYKYNQLHDAVYVENNPYFIQYQTVNRTKTFSKRVFLSPLLSSCSSSRMSLQYFRLDVFVEKALVETSSNNGLTLTMRILVYKSVGTNL